MKKAIYCLFVFVITTAFLAVTVPGSVSASAGDIGSGTWVTPGSSLAFTTINVDKAAKSAPTWLQQLSEGIVITAPAKICYPFRGGEFGWQPSIRQLSDGKWSAVSTKIEFPFTKEAGSYACTSAPASGTYALFGYYKGPVETVSSGLPVCTGFDTIAWYRNGHNIVDEVDHPILMIWLEPMLEGYSGQTISFSILDFDYSGEGTLTLSPMNSPFACSVDECVYQVNRSADLDITAIRIRVTTPSCYQDIDLRNLDD